jgi:hypothetical protein
MRIKRAITLAGLTAAVLSAGLWVLVPAWGGQAPATQKMAGMAGMADMGTGNGNLVLTRDIAAAREATAKYATNLGKAKADGYRIITKMMPNMGFHFLNPAITGFDVRKPPILVYEHTATGWQLGALEWVFTSMPKTAPLPNATFGFFPAGCHYDDGTFIPEPAQTDCPKKAPSGATFFFWHPDLFTLHAWVWYPNPAGLYSSTNPLVTPFNGG